MIVETERFLIKTLVPSDVTDRYMMWMREAVSSEFISYDQGVDIVTLKNYVRSMQDDKKIIFFGIYTKEGRLHIGNIKFDPVDSEKKYAIMGVLIGDAGWRGRGVFGEVIKNVGTFLKNNHNIETIYLGVAKGNKAAVSAYRKAGFVEKRFIPELCG